MTHARDHRGVKGGREGSRRRRSIESLPREKESDEAHRLRDRMAYQRISKISLLALLAAATPRPGHQPIITIRYDYAIIVMQPVGLRNYAGELRYRVYVFQSARINKIKRPREAPISLFLSLSFSLSLSYWLYIPRVVRISGGGSHFRRRREDCFAKKGGTVNFMRNISSGEYKSPIKDIVGDID